LEQEIHVTSAKKALAGDNGAFYWPANFSLKEAAAEKKGGWIIQQVVISYFIWDSGKPKPKKSKPHPGLTGKVLDWYEAFRVEPGQTEPPKGPLDKDALIMADANGLGKPTDKANDFYVLSGPPNTDGEIEYKGRLWFFDCLSEKRLDNNDPILADFGFKRNRKDTPAGKQSSLPNTPFYAREIEKFFKLPHTDGKEVHNIKVTWTGKKTTIQSQEPA
jgi:hypothetical protein